MTAAIYTRYSSDNQDETSTQDQMRLAMQYAERHGLRVCGVYSDEELSGFMTVERRPQGAKLLAACARGEVKTIIIESLDRLSRNLVDQETIVRRLEFSGVRIVSTSDGYDSLRDDREMQRGFRGLMNEQYLRDLKKKTHRGLSGQVHRGYHAGGSVYGYESVPDGKGFKLTINEEQAKHVRWIFEQYAAGKSCQKIAAELNLNRIPSPRNSTWAVSALYGCPAKGSGILNNATYVGHYIWNRSRWEKHPDTGKRVRIDRPKEEWQIMERPELRIIDDALWQKVRNRIDKPSLKGGSKGAGRPARTLFGGLLTCHQCGGPMIAVNAHKYGCANHKDRGDAVCDSKLLVSREKTDQRLLSLVREELLSPAALVEMQNAVKQLIESEQSSASASHHAAKKRLAEIDKEIGRLVDAIAAVGVSPALAEKLKAAEAEKAALKEAPAQGKPSIEMAAMVARYKEMVLDLQNALAKDTNHARTLLAELLGKVVLVPAEGGVCAEIENGPAIAEPSSLIMVAGAGFEPTTFGL
ncbi:recombinase family protein [Parvibium lacunae]|uniref:Recombinase family protein n=1 Tax=Parvibium lacunae TaxID=1888893 RepID=A0A368L8Q8_9BURK|nr:recombinase family protein [Parvibium lacunae]